MDFEEIRISKMTYFYSTKIFESVIRLDTVKDYFKRRIKSQRERDP